MASTGTAKTAAPLKKMLVVDPGSVVNDVLNRLVAEEGWSLHRSPDNQAVLSDMEIFPFDLIITGQETTGREDLDLLRKIRRTRPHIRMIIITDKGTPDDIVAALRENAFLFLRTPFEPAQLSDMVRLAMTEPPWDDGIEVISVTPQWIRLLVRCTHGTAERLIQFIRQADLPDGEREDLAAAIHEILLNAMEHGGRFDPDKYVEMGYLRTKRAIACRMKDPGNGFSLQELRHAAINSPPGDLFTHMEVREQHGLRPGGFGILMARKLVDDVIYSEHGNDVILIKYLDPPATPTQ